MATSPRRSLRGLPSLLLALLLGGLAFAVPAGSAQAEDGYRYWNYLHLAGKTWKFSTVGAGSYHPKDGAVEGWRYGTGTQSKSIEPRADLSAVTFGSVCAGTTAPSGQKRVAVVIDYGTKADSEGADAPQNRAACAVVPAGATGQQVIESVAKVRASKGFTCALDGYPATGCGSPVPNANVPSSEPTTAFALPSANTSDEDSQSSSNLALPLVGAVVVVGLVAAGAVAARRRRVA